MTLFENRGFANEIKVRMDRRIKVSPKCKDRVFMRGRKGTQRYIEKTESDRR